MNKIDWSKVSIASAKPALEDALRNDIFGQVHREMIQYDSVMMEWLNVSPENRQAYADDPIGCFKRIAKPTEATMQILNMVNQLPQDEVCAFYTARMSAPGKVDRPDAENYVDMHNWDVISTIKVAKINKIVKYAQENKYIPSSLVYKFSNPMLMMLGSVECQFGVPSITAGDGQYITVTFPLKDKIKVFGEDYPIESENTAVKMLIQLHAVSSKSEEKGEEYIFSLNLSKEFLVKVTTADFPEKLMEKVGSEAVLDFAFKLAFEETIENRDIELCRVKGSQVKEDYKFLLPTKARYIMNYHDKLDNAQLCIVMLTTSKEEGEPVVDQEIGKDGCDGCIIISNQLFMDNVIRKALVSSCNVETGNLKCSKLRIGDRETLQLENINDFDYKKVEGYVPRVTKLTFSGYNNRFHIYMTADVSPSAGITLHYKANGEYSASFSAGKINEQKFLLKEESYHSDHDLDIEWWVWMIAALASVLALWLTGPIVGLLLSGLSFGSIGIADAIIESVAPSGIKSSVFLDAASNVKWEHADIVSFESVNIDSNIQLEVKLPLFDD